VRADSYVDSSEREKSFFPRCGRGRGRGARVASIARGSESSTSICQLGVDVAAGEEPEVPDLDVAARQNVEKETANEFVWRDDRVLAAFRTEADAVLVERNESMVRDADPVRVSTEIPEDLFGSGERTLGVDHPVLAVEEVL
jgi:hypothetical protein